MEINKNWLSKLVGVNEKLQEKIREDKINLESLPIQFHYLLGYIDSAQRY